jgi:DNA-binding GntR family transcriptional regulator
MKSRVLTFNNLKTPPTLKTMAFDAIRESIINGTLKPGEVYSEQLLATELGISKTPVHDALIKLQIRGFITILPQRGFQIKTLDRKDIKDLYEFRDALERAVIRHIAPRITASQLEACRPFLVDIDQFDSPMSFLQNDMNFHFYMAELTSNPQIITALEEIWDLCLWVGYGSLEQKGSIGNVTSEHKEIFEVLGNHDVVAAESLIAKHLQVTLERVLQGK